jgi:hypothetical protein
MVANILDQQIMALQLVAAVKHAPQMDPGPRWEAKLVCNLADLTSTIKVLE